MLVEESTVSFSISGSGIYAATLGSTFAPTVGETYKITWDGTVYECTCVSSPNNMKLIGNPSIMGDTVDTGEPFIIADSDQGVHIGTLDTSPTHTISISQEVGAEVVKIDQKYLPKAAFITYNSSSNTYSSDLTNDELYERLLDGKQVVLHGADNEYLYLTRWRKLSSGRIDLAFAGDNYSVSLLTDGTIGKYIMA